MTPVDPNRNNGGGHRSIVDFDKLLHRFGNKRGAQVGVLSLESLHKIGDLFMDFVRSDERNKGFPLVFNEQLRLFAQLYEPICERVFDQMSQEYDSAHRVGVPDRAVQHPVDLICNRILQGHVEGCEGLTPSEREQVVQHVMGCAERYYSSGNFPFSSLELLNDATGFAHRLSQRRHPQ
jgi:hypothetical protein